MNFELPIWGKIQKNQKSFLYKKRALDKVYTYI